MPANCLTVAQSRNWLEDAAGVSKNDIDALLHNARRERVVIYTADRSFTDQTPVYILDNHPKYGPYRTTNIVSMIQHLDGA